MKILIAQTIFLGDVILTLPLVQRLKKEFPHAQIDFFVHARNASILENHSSVSRIVPFDKEGKHRGIRGIFQLARALRSQRYDAAVILPGSVRTAFVVYLADIPRRIGSDQSSGMLLFDDAIKFPREARRSIHNRVIYFLEKLWKLGGRKYSFTSLLYTDIVSLRRDVHAVRRYMALLEPLGISIDENIIPQLYPDEEDCRVVDRLFDSRDSVLLAVAPGSVWETKRWPTEYFAEVMKKISDNAKNVTFLLIGGTEDVEICQFIQKQVDGVTMIDCSGKLTPLQSAEALRRCRVLITNDTAPMHLASAMGTPCVAIYGPTIPAFGFTPFGNKHVIVEQTSLWCRPCTPHGGHRCPIGTHECMKSISPESVLRKVTEFL